MSGWSLLFQIVNFVVLAVLLRAFLFKPVSAMTKRRQEGIDRTRSEGERIRHEAEELRSQAEQAMTQIGQERERALTETREQQRREHDEVLAKTRQEAEAVLEAARRDIEHEREEAAGALAKGVVELGAGLAQKLLAQLATSGLAETFLEHLRAQLDTLGDERVRALREELDGQPLLIATAPALSADAAQRWVRDIAARIGPGVVARAVGDDSLVAGAELRFPHTTLSFCWRDGLTSAREELLRHDDHR